MSEEKSRAIELADAFDQASNAWDAGNDYGSAMSAELRRQDAEIVALKTQEHILNDRIYDLEQSHAELKVQFAQGEPTAWRATLELAKIGLRDWELPENRYKALEAIDAMLTDPQPSPQGEELQKLLTASYAKGRDDANRAWQARAALNHPAEQSEPVALVHDFGVE